MTRLRRSLLFVPGGEPRKIERALGIGADTLLLDLEDSVAPDRKAEARAIVAETLRAHSSTRSELAVRVNAAGSDEIAADLEAVIGAGGSTVLLPKCESAASLTAIADTELVLLALVESPAGIVAAGEIGGVEKVQALCFGHADFSLEMGLTGADASQGIAFHARCALAIAARACSVAPVDSVFLDVRDSQAFRCDAELGVALGFDGKLCIHPAQVEIAHEVYTPTAQQIEQALRVVEAASSAQTEGRAVFALDGKMVDAPLVALQQRVLERARLAGALPPD